VDKAFELALWDHAFGEYGTGFCHRDGVAVSRCRVNFRAADHTSLRGMMLTPDTAGEFVQRIPKLVFNGGHTFPGTGEHYLNTIRFRSKAQDENWVNPNRQNGPTKTTGRCVGSSVFSLLADARVND
jgi:hypothetical protein